MHAVIAKLTTILGWLIPFSDAPFTKEGGVFDPDG